MHWPPRQPAISSDGRILPNHPISIRMPAVAPPRVSFADALEKRGIVFPLGGWLPGMHQARCLICQDLHEGTDERSIRCLPCGIVSALMHGQGLGDGDKSFAELRAYREGRQSVIDDLKKLEAGHEAPRS